MRQQCSSTNQRFSFKGPWGDSNILSIAPNGCHLQMAEFRGPGTSPTETFLRVNFGNKRLESVHAYRGHFEGHRHIICAGLKVGAAGRWDLSLHLQFCFIFFFFLENEEKAHLQNYLTF